MLRPRAPLTTVCCFIIFAGYAVAQIPVQEHLSLPDIRMHDPWILADQPSHTYYMYAGSSPEASSRHRSGVITYTSKDLNTWAGPYLVFEVPDGSWADLTAGVWAPEVHYYHGKYY